MTTTDMRQHPEAEPGLSRRSMLNRTATGLGIALSGSIPGLFGADTAGAGSMDGPPREVGYGLLVPDPAGILSLPAGVYVHDRRRVGRDAARQR
jgi:uncharacterized protein